MLLPLCSSLHRFLTRIEDQYDRRRNSRPLDFLPLSISNLLQEYDWDWWYGSQWWWKVRSFSTITLHAGPSGLTHDDSMLLNPSHDCEDFVMDYLAPSQAPLSNDDNPISHDYSTMTEEAYIWSVKATSFWTDWTSCRTLTFKPYPWSQGHFYGSSSTINISSSQWWCWHAYGKWWWSLWPIQLMSISTDCRWCWKDRSTTVRVKCSCALCE